MDMNDDKKKESIDDILSDLNGLLNRMPSILDGIKMPVVNPVEFTSRASEAAPSAQSAAKKAEKEESELTFEAEQAAVPLPQGGVEESTVPPQKFVLQTLGDHLFSEEANQPSVVKAEPADAFEISFPDTEVPVSGVPAEPPAARPSALPDSAPAVKFESTIDFGIPDIDALLEISNAHASAAPSNPPAGAVPGAGAQPQTASPGDMEQELAKLVLQAEAPIDEVDAPTPAEPEVPPMILNENDQSADSGKNQGQQDETLKITPEEAPLDGLVLQDPVAPEQALPARSQQDETLRITPEEAPSEGLVLQQPAVQEPEAQGLQEAGAADQAGGPPGLVQHGGEGLVLEQTREAFSKEQPSDESDKTLVVAPRDEAGGDNDRTVVYNPGSPAAAIRTGGGDLSSLAQQQPPEGVPEERTRSLGFVYAEGEDGLCAGILSEIDAICLKSQAKPMFVRRAFVKPFEADTNPNFIAQAVTDAKAAGLILIGNLPQDKIHELESVFSASGVLFRHLNAENFNHSAALDLVVEVILR